MLEGYAAMLGAAPTVKEDNNPLANDISIEGGFSAYFNKRIVNMVKGNVLATRLPQLIKDARSMLDEIAANANNITDPFVSLLHMGSPGRHHM